LQLFPETWWASEGCRWLLLHLALKPHLISAARDAPGC
jgi:hypothetical protein